MSKKCLPDSEELNTSFAQAVEKHPCLYDNTLKEYSDRNEQDKAWNGIARKFYTTEDECKKKWKVLRGGLTRYIKQRNSSPKSIKPYYLWEVMQFVIPFTKSRIQSRNLLDENLKLENFQSDEIVESNEYSENEENEESSNANSETPIHSPQTPSEHFGDFLSERSSVKRKKIPPKSSTDEMENAVVRYLSQKQEIKLDNPDLEFFKSILPDVAALTASQKRRFKVKILQTLEDFSNENNTQLSQSSVTHTVFCQ